MSPVTDLPAFAGCGIELEYMIVDHGRLSVMPVADRLLTVSDGRCVSELPRGPLAWSNELVSHLIELKTGPPVSGLDKLPLAFAAEIAQINALLAPMGGCLMPTAMHPWMDPRSETRLWRHEHGEIYAAYDRIFDCRRHGWANLQSMHLNLPFADDDEFRRLHAAVRSVLPILPALAASSPFADGRRMPFMDYRLEVYRRHPERIPSLIGDVIPDNSASPSEYRRRVLAPMYEDIAELDRGGVLRHEWLNCRGAIPRFDRSALEIRVIDVQECPLADLAMGAVVFALVKSAYEERWAGLDRQQRLPTRMLSDILFRCARLADEALIGEPEYLAAFGFAPTPVSAGTLWRGLIDEVVPGWDRPSGTWRAPLAAFIEQGPLAQRIVRAVGPAVTRDRLESTYRQLCECLADNRVFLAPE